MVQAELNAIRGFIAALLREHDDETAFGDGESLIKAGRLDSLAVVTLVNYLESDFAVDFTTVEFDPERFDTVASIAELIDESRRAR